MNEIAHRWFGQARPVLAWKNCLRSGPSANRTYEPLSADLCRGRQCRLPQGSQNDLRAFSLESTNLVPEFIAGILRVPRHHLVNAAVDGTRYCLWSPDTDTGLLLPVPTLPLPPGSEPTGRIAR